MSEAIAYTLRRRDRQSPLIAASFASGFAALTYQAVWQRALTQIVGADAVSVAIVVAAFMAGLGVGALVGAHLIRRPLDKTKLYAGVEIAIAAFGVIAVPALRVINDTVAEISAGSLAIDVSLNIGLLFLPICLMGITSPLIVEIGKHTLGDFGRRTGSLYGANILGAALGAAITGLIAIELIGLVGVCVLAAFCNLAAALLVFRVGKVPSGSPEIMASRMHVGSGSPDLRIGVLALGCVFLGYASLALQIVFFRVLANYFTLSAMVFPIVLTAFLLLMSAGQKAGGHLVDRVSTRQSPRLLATLSIASAALVFGAFALPPAWMASLGALVFSPSVASLAPETGARIGDPIPLVAFAFALVLMVGVLPQAALFPVTVKVATERVEIGGRRFAQVYGAYTLGNLVGTLVTGLVLFEQIGTVGATRVAFLASAIGVTLVSAAVAPWRASVRASIVALLAAVVAMLAVPNDYYSRFSAGRYKIAETDEGRSGVVSVVPTERFYTLVDVFRTESASAITRPPAEADRYEAWRWNFSDALALDPSFRPRRILLIGIGHGYLPLTLLDYDFVEKIVVVDISSEVVKAVSRWSSADLNRIFSDPRVEIVVADGRRYLQGALSRGERFDLIQNRVNEPWRAGSSALFTVEFFKVMKRALNPGGIVATRHMAGYAVNGLEAFATGVWTRGSYHMYFSDGLTLVPTHAIVTPDIRTAFFSGYPGVQIPKETRAYLDVVTLTREHFSGYPLNTDNRPVFEYHLIDDLLGGKRRRLREFLDSMNLESVRLPLSDAPLVSKARTTDASNRK